MKKIKIFYIIGLIFFLSIFLFATLQKIKLFSNNTFSEAVYDNGLIYIIENEKVTEKNYKTNTDAPLKSGQNVYILHNEESEYAYVVNFNEIINQELFVLIFIIMFALLLRKEK
jgi:hypothetical protein